MSSVETQSLKMEPNVDFSFGMKRDPELVEYMANENNWFRDAPKTETFYKPIASYGGMSNFELPMTRTFLIPATTDAEADTRVRSEMDAWYLNGRVGALTAKNACHRRAKMRYQALKEEEARATALDHEFNEKEAARLREYDMRAADPMYGMRNASMQDNDDGMGIAGGRRRKPKAASSKSTATRTRSTSRKPSTSSRSRSLSRSKKPSAVKRAGPKSRKTSKSPAAKKRASSKK